MPFPVHRADEGESFGYLVINLPSLHTGGDLVLINEEDSNTFQPSEHSKFFSSYGAWYSDVTQETTPVLSGFQLSLIYQLAAAEPSDNPGFRWPTAGDLRTRRLKIEKSLMRWKSDLALRKPDCPPVLVYDFSFNYSTPELKQVGLSDAHQQTLQGMGNVWAPNDFVVYPARAEAKTLLHGSPGFF